MVVGNAKRNPIVILTPEREVAEAVEKVMNITTLPNDVPKDEEGSSQDERDVDRVEANVPEGASRTGTWEDEVNLTPLEDPT